MSDTEKSGTPPSKQEIMREIGAALAERRKVRGMTVEKVAQILKIRIPYLKAMEKGEWSELPGDVYARGFVKRYAQFLGLDGDKLLAPYIAERPASPEHEDVPNPEGGSDISRGVLIAVAVVAVFVIVIFKLVSQDRAPVSPGPSVESPVSPAEPATASSAPVASAAGGETAGQGTHRIEVHSPFPLWLRVQAEDRNFEGFIPQASTWSWSAKGKFSVRLGHSRQVSMTFDGEPVVLKENQKRVDLPE
jgi:transcriptional regulator with XRE-family HTH domain